MGISLNIIYFYTIYLYKVYNFNLKIGVYISYYNTMYDEDKYRKAYLCKLGKYLGIYLAQLHEYLFL